MLILTREEYSITGPPIPKNDRINFSWDFLRAKLLAMSALLSLTYGFAFLISALIPKAAVLQVCCTSLRSIYHTT